MILARAPLRIPLGGGGTDLPSYYAQFGGFFVSAAVNKYVFININRPSADEFIRVKYSRYEQVTTVDEVQHELVRESLKMLCLGPSLEIGSMADVPAGTGMGTSGSYLVALLLGLHSLKRDIVPTWQIAEEACHVEIDLVGHPVGKQDQYIAAFGGLTCFEVERNGRVHVSPLRVPGQCVEDLRSNTLLFYTGQTRRSLDILEDQKQDTATGKQSVVDSLHVTKQIGYEIKDALEDGDLVRYGKLLHRHWLNKKRRSAKISDASVDRCYDVARSKGALGGKVMGAGGGGFLMLFTTPEAKQSVREAMAAEGLREMPFDFDLDGAKVLVNF
jgi:D-glycero-alpha-D-manno-heptose-7-phosphate kinase